MNLIRHILFIFTVGEGGKLVKVSSKQQPHDSVATKFTDSDDIFLRNDAKLRHKKAFKVEELLRKLRGISQFLVLWYTNR